MSVTVDESGGFLVLRNHSCLFARGLFTPADVMSVTPPKHTAFGPFCAGN
jgi:hypothetical protein